MTLPSKNLLTRTSSADVASGARTATTSRRSKLGLAIALATLGSLSSGVAAAISVIPHALGYGLDTPAGRGGTVHRVTNLKDSGAGSLRACVDATGPRVCVFEVSGTIRMAGDLAVRNPKITIAGQTAPSPGIMLRGGGLLIRTSDVLVQHLRVRPGDDPGGTVFDNRDALKIESTTPIKNVVVDHCSFSWSIDEIASAWVGWTDISLLNNIFAEPLNDSLHSKGPHGYGILLGPVNGKATLIGNLMAHNVSRNPLTNATHAVIVNNVIYNWQNNAVDLQNQGGVVTYNTVIGNVFLRGADYARNAPVSLRADATALKQGSKVYLSDNHATESTTDPWSVAGTMNGSLTLSDFRAADPPVWPTGMTTLPTSENVVLNYVLSNVGARPADRDSTDKRIVEGVRSRTGQIINCVAPNGTARCAKNGGGWPVLAENHRALTLPANPNTVTASGYTNLELWLHKMSAEVEGRSGPLPQPPSLADTGP